MLPTQIINTRSKATDSKSLTPFKIMFRLDSIILLLYIYHITLKQYKISEMTSKPKLFYLMPKYLKVCKGIRNSMRPCGS